MENTHKVHAQEMGTLVEVEVFIGQFTSHNMLLYFARCTEHLIHYLRKGYKKNPLYN